MKKSAIFVCLAALILSACGGEDPAEPTGPAPVPDGPLARSLRGELSQVGLDPAPAFAQMLQEDVFLTVCSSGKAIDAQQSSLEEQRKSLEDALLASMTASLSTCEQAGGGLCHTFAADDWSSALKAADQTTRLAAAFRLYEGGRDPSDMIELLSSLLPLLQTHVNDWLAAHNREAADSIKAEAQALGNAGALVGGLTDTVQSFGYDGFQPADAAAEQMRNLQNSFERMSGIMSASDFSAANNQPYIDAILPAAKTAQAALNNLNALHTDTKAAAENCSGDVVWPLLEPIGAVREQVKRLEACVQSGSCAIGQEQ